MSKQRLQYFGFGSLFLLVLVSAFAVIGSKHFNRNQHIQLQQLQQIKDKLHEEWTQLLLEQGTLGSDVQVEKVARDRLKMIIPSKDNIVVVKP